MFLAGLVVGLLIGAAVVCGFFVFGEEPPC
jgi:hypothetical protein